MGGVGSEHLLSQFGFRRLRHLVRLFFVVGLLSLLSLSSSRSLRFTIEKTAAHLDSKVRPSYHLHFNAAKLALSRFAIRLPGEQVVS